MMLGNIFRGSGTGTRQIGTGTKAENHQWPSGTGTMQTGNGTP